MARKDARLMLEEAGAAKCPARVLPAIAARMDAVDRRGPRAGDDWTVLAKSSLSDD